MAKYSNFILFFTISIATNLTFTQSALAEDAAPVSLVQAFQQGKAYVSGRYRYELVDQDGFDKNAKASTLQARLGFETAKYLDTQALLEFESVQEIGNDLYNNTINGRTDRPTVADVDSTEVNQAYLTYSGIPDTVIKPGRQVIVLDNVRFVGDVAWRQNNQTFDAATLMNSSLPDTKFFYSYILNVNRIFGDDSPVGDFDSNIHLFNLKNVTCPLGALTLYSYLLDINDSLALSTSTFGGRFDGKYSLSEDFSLLYDLEYAYQQDYEDNPVDFSANYYRTEAGLSWMNLTAKGGFESLGSDDGVVGFSTPLATLHAWNGWADKFLNTPATGLEDMYGLLAYTFPKLNDIIDEVKLTAVYHYFTADEGSDDYGTEWDADLTVAFLTRYSFGIRYANYNAEDFDTDTEKLIFTLATKFSQ